jgi:molybdate transport system ATP-binding protein
MKPPVLDFDLTFTRGTYTLRAKAQFKAGVTGIRGPSGVGKTTLLHLLAGLLPPTAGHLTLHTAAEAMPLVNVAQKIFVPAWRRHFGVVFQEGLLFPHLDVRRNLLFGVPNPAPQDRRFGLPAVAELLEISPLLERLPRQLSGGERQRVALGRALLQAPRLLLLDEPLAALDDRLKDQILPFLERVRAETDLPMVYVSHSTAKLDRLADTQYLLAEGELLPL